MSGKGYKYDAELFLEDIEKVFKSKLNNQIALINDEKQNRSPGLNGKFDISPINDDAWYFNHIPNVWSYPQFIVWGLQDVSFQRPQSDASIEKFIAFIEVAITDDGSVPNEQFIYKLLRYSRALQDVANKNFDSIRGYGKLQVEGLSPALVSISDKTLRISGITITASIGTR